VKHEIISPYRIQESLLRFIAEEILQDPARVVQAEEPLITSGLIDSFHLVDLALYVEDLFRIRIEDTELAASVFDSVSELTELIMDRIPDKLP
jgi:acyl carrier protein